MTTKRPTQKQFDNAVERLRKLLYDAIKSTEWQSHEDAVNEVEAGFNKIKNVYELTSVNKQ